MSLEDRAMARAEAAATLWQRERIAGIADGLDGIAGLVVSAERDALIIEGRGLGKLWLSDARLRFAAGGSR